MTLIHVICRSKEHRALDLDRETIMVGRSSDSDIILEDISASRNHLMIRQNGDIYRIRDLKSTNGTFVGGKQLDPEDDIEVKEGVPIVVGKTIISIGRAFEGDTAEVFEAIDFSKKAGSTSRIHEEDRPMTPKNNMEFVCKLSRLLGETLDIKSIMEGVLRIIFDLLKRIDRGAVLLMDGETGKIQDVVTGFKGTPDEGVVECCRTVADHCLREGKPVMISNAFIGGEGEIPGALSSKDIGSAMCIPLISRSKTWGVIYFDSIEKPYGFRREDIGLISAMGVPTALAIENAWLYSKNTV